MKRKTILIVEDDKDVARYYSAIFEEKYEVIVTFSGRHALRRLNQLPETHLAIIDYRLPDISGLDVLREIKKCRPSVPVILVTAYGDENVAVKALRYGAKDYIKKPVAYDDLLERVEFFLSLHNAEKKERKSVCPEEHHAAPAPLKDIASCRQLNYIDAQFHKPRRIFASNGTAPCSFDHSKIKKALQFIDDNFTIKISLESVAEKACLSRYHFSRAFKRATGITYQEYLTMRRVEQAKKLLMDPGGASRKSRILSATMI